jgi:LL-diaminopimelate aminotransferase
LPRLANLPPYLFAEIDAAKRRARAAGREVIDLGVGDPDRPTPALLVAALARAAQVVEHHRYPAGPGRPSLRQAIAGWLRRRHHIEVDPDSEILVLVGSKEGLGHLPLSQLAEGDEALVPDPGYPVYGQATILAGGRPRPFRLAPAAGFRPDWQEVREVCGPRTRLLFLNYPNNPTGATADRGLFARAAELAEERDLVLVNDAAYLEVHDLPVPPPSLLSVAPPSSGRVLEFHSLSKSFNMTGWRIGFAVGSAGLIRDLARVKESLDSGVFTAIQAVAETALGEQGAGLIEETVSIYPSRRRLLVEALARASLEVFPTAATFYVWARVPAGMDSLSFCRRVLEEQGVVLTPGVGFGPGGEGWFRASLTAPEQEIALAAERLGRL